MLPSIERTEPARTVIVPRVGPPAARSRWRFLLPWLAFGAVAVVVIGGTTLWSVALRTSAASRATPEPAGIDTAARLVAPSVVALPTTPGAATATTAAVVTAAHSPASRPHAVVPPARLPRSAVAPSSAVPPPDPAPTTLPAPVACDEADVLSECAPASRAKGSAKASATRTTTET